MNSTALAKQLKRMGYTLKKTSDVEARWMVSSDVMTFHWNFKHLKHVERFMKDEHSFIKAMRVERA